MRHLVYNVRHFVVPINSKLLTIMLYSWVIKHSFVTTLIIQFFLGVITEFDCMWLLV
jgi:hypothetical protein